MIRSEDRRDGALIRLMHERLGARRRVFCSSLSPAIGQRRLSQTMFATALLLLPVCAAPPSWRRTAEDPDAPSAPMLLLHSPPSSAVDPLRSGSIALGVKNPPAGAKWFKVEQVDGPSFSGFPAWIPAYAQSNYSVKWWSEYAVCALHLRTTAA